MTLLDTDMLTLLFRGHPNVTQRVSQADNSGGVTITSVTRIEALQGRFDSVLKAENAERLLWAVEALRTTEEKLRGFQPIDFDPASATKFEELRQNKRLRAIGRNDLLIATIALANDALLVSRNLKDFRQLPGLRVENWAD